MAGGATAPHGHGADVELIRPDIEADNYRHARPSREFVDGTFQEVLRRTEKSTGKRAEREPVIKEYADWSVRPFNVTVDTTRVGAVTLADATVY